MGATKNAKRRGVPRYCKEMHILRALGVSNSKSSNEKIVWRYISLGAFEATLAKKSLRFKQLQHFPDEWEGLPKDSPKSNNSAKFEKINSNDSKELNYARNFGYASCWTYNYPHQMTMWTAYAECSSWISFAVHQDYLANLETDHETFEACNVTYDGTDPDVINPKLGHLAFKKQEKFYFEREYRLFFADDSFELKKNNISRKPHFDIKFDISEILKVAQHPYMGDHARLRLETMLKKFALANVRCESDSLPQVPDAVPSQAFNHRLRRCSYFNSKYKSFPLKWRCECK